MRNQSISDQIKSFCVVGVGKVLALNPLGIGALFIVLVCAFASLCVRPIDLTLGWPLVPQEDSPHGTTEH